jgi:peptidoglycan/xylan/chitin deacetylase (PgdA/CDA1 family)
LTGNNSLAGAATVTTLSRRTFLKFSAVSFAGLAAAAVARPAFAAEPAKPQALSSVNPSNRRLALTFDDGYFHVARLLEVCKEVEVRLTLFPIGKVITANPDLWKRALDEGHEIGCHTYSHPALGGKSYDFVAGELSQFMDVARQRLGIERVRYFRPPYSSGWSDEAVQRAARDFGMAIVMWDRTNDSKKLAARPTWRDVATDFKKHARAGDIVLYHFQFNEVAALKSIVAHCRAQGWAVATISDLTSA